jgi:hypothetical protein
MTPVATAAEQCICPSPSAASPRWRRPGRCTGTSLAAALALVEERTGLALGGRVSQAELDATVSDAREALGPGW